MIYIVLPGLTDDGLPVSVLVNEADYEGDPAEFFAPGDVDPDSIREDGEVAIAAGGIQLEPVYKSTGH